MPRLIKCPSCATQMDVGDAQPGTVVGCPGCQVKIRIPTGKTGKHPAISGGATPAPAPAPQVAPARASTGSSSRVRRRGTTTKTRTASVGSRRGYGGRGGDEGDEEGGRYAPPEKKKNTGLIVGICVGAVVLVGLIIIIVASSGNKSRGPIAPRAKIDDDMTASAPPPPPAPVDPTPVVPSGPAEPPPGAGSNLKPGAAAPKGRAQWDKYIDGLKKFGIKNPDPPFYEFEADDIDPECKHAWQIVKRMGSNAYPYLLHYLADEDPQRVRGAAAALWTLLNLPGRMPKPGQGVALQGELKSKCGVSDADIQKAAEELK